MKVTGPRRTRATRSRSARADGEEIEVFVSYLFTDASWDAAGNRGAALDPGLAHYAFEMGNIGPTPWSAWVASPRSAAGRFSRHGSSLDGWAG
jgi:hypothetical protein